MTPNKTASAGLMSRRDLVIRDHTLKFIQAISVFIKYLNGESDEAAGRKLDGELKEILVSFKSFVNAIESIEVVNDAAAANEQALLATRKQVGRQLSDLDERLSLMISEFRLNKIENVVSLALEVARNANEIFLNLAQLTTV